MFLTRLLVPTGLCSIFVLGVLTSASVFAGNRLSQTNEIAFMSYHEVNPDIFVMDIDRVVTLNLTRSAAYEGTPSWSPDGNWIAFTSDRHGGLNIYVMDANGRNVRQLTDGANSYDSPRWSADGQRLVFFARGGLQELYSINFDGSDFQQLTSAFQPVTGVLLDLGIEQLGSAARVPSPDRTQILRIGLEGREWVIFLSGDNSLEERVLTTIGRGYTEPPIWSPSGERVVFVGSLGGRSDIYMVDVSSGGTQRLTQTRAIEAIPAWRPIS
jgi:TolB protein